MYELKVTVKKVMGECTADPPMKPGDYFTVSDGDIQVPEGGYICLWALQSLMPLITPKEREISEKQDEDWMWRVHHAQRSRMRTGCGACITLNVPTRTAEWSSRSSAPVRSKETTG